MPQAGENLPMPQAAESCGADLVINSVHKTLGSLTQSAVLNVCGGGVFAGEDPELTRQNLYKLEDKLQAVESTSPSYILMGSLDISADILKEHGEELIGAWREDLQWFYGEAKKIPGLKIMDPAMQSGQMDRTKINLDMSGCGLDGGQLEEALMEQGIFAELVTGDILMCMTGIGNTREDYVRLVEALQQIAAGSGVSGSETSRSDDSDAGGGAFIYICSDLAAV